MTRLSGLSVFELPVGAGLSHSYVAEVVSVKDPQNLSRVQVRLLNADGVTDQDGPVWARVAVPFAGDGHGSFFIPDVGDEVLVSFVNGDSRMPIVLGGLWNGNASPPETLGGSGQSVDRWTLVGKRKTRIAIIEEQDGQATIELSTPGGVKATFKETSGGTIKCEAAGTTITVDTSGVNITSAAKVQIKATQLSVDAGQVQVNAGMSTFSGVVQCDTLIATTVIGSTYTPGAGNVW